MADMPGSRKRPIVGGLISPLGEIDEGDAQDEYEASKARQIN